jgi:transposase InsO family protein
LYGGHPDHDATCYVDDPHYWWSSGIDDISDDYMYGWFVFSQCTLGLCDAPYQFTISIEFDPVPSPPKLPWRNRRTARRRLAKLSAQTPVDPPTSSPECLPTYDTITQHFINSINPATSVRALLPKSPFPRNLQLAVDLKSFQSTQSSSTVLLNYVFNISPSDEPLIVDTGASVCITPHLDDFVPGTYQSSSLIVKDLSGANEVAGEGTIAWSVVDDTGITQTIIVPGVHIASAKVRLLSPQVLMTHSDSTMTMTKSGVRFSYASGHSVSAPINKRMNLPQLRLSNDPPLPDSPFGFNTFGFEAELASDWDSSIADYNSFLSVLRSENSNLRASQKEMLLWHHRLSHFSMSTVRSLMLPNERLLPDDRGHQALHQAPILPIRHPGTARVDTSRCKCGPCLMAKARRRPTSSKTPRGDIQPGSALRRNHLNPGQCISCDHFICSDRGRRIDTFGRNTSTKGYVGGALYVDHASGKIFHYPQTDLTAEQTIRGKQIVERAAEDAGFSVKAYHSDNGIFASTEFRDHCASLKQSISFSGAHAHHQNGIAERSIGTISSCARANLIHLMLCWPNQANINLWAFAINYAIWVYNRLPSPMLGGLSPDECWSRNRSSHEELRRAHVFGCPVYVLDPRLADGDSIPKWNHRARMGMFLGFSNEHSSLVPLVLNLRTGHVSSQYHVIFDDNFETVPSLNPSESDIDDKFAALFDSSKEFYLDQIADDDDTQLPPLDSDWDDDFTSPEGETTVPEGASTAPEGVPTAPEGDAFDFDNPPALNRRSRITRNHTPSYIGAIALTAVTLPLAQALHLWADLPAGIMNDPPPHHGYNPTGRLVYRDLAESSLIASPWQEVASAFTAGYSGALLNHGIDSESPNPQKQRIQSLLEPDLSLSDSDDLSPSAISPFALAAKSAANSADNPSYDEAMQGIYKHEYAEAARVELHTLQNDLDCWELVPRTDDMNVLPSTWAFKCKRFPDGRVKKFKARFCARGDRQKEGIDYFETWSPVVQWTTVRIMLIFSCILRLKSVQADITAAFVHATLPEVEEVYVHQPRGFFAPGTTSKSHVLKLKRALYGLKQAPRHFFNYLSQHLIKHGLKQSSFDPCLFIGSDIVVIVYVDDLLLYSCTDGPIDDLIAKLKADNIWIRKEDSAAGFLGVDMKESKDGSLTLTQSGLTERVIKALGLHSQYSTKKDTPAETSPLPKDSNGEPADPTINYASVIGMLLYLSGHSRPDIAFAVHQCARYTFNPTKKHVNALKRIGRYLKGTRGKGIILRPSTNLQIECYPDADFAGLYNHEDSQDPHCVRSRTGYVILLAGCPVLWKSKLQTEIALSTMEAEYVALSQSCKDLFPLLDQINELGAAVGLPISKESLLHTTIYEDNVGALTLGRLEPKRMTPRSKHYAIKYHWFREQIGPRNIKLVKVDTKNQLGDIFTKGLGFVPFSYLRSKLMGW